MESSISNQRGSAMVMTLGAILVLSLIALSMVAVVVLEKRTSFSAYAGARSFYSADAAGEAGVNWIRHQLLAGGRSWIPRAASSSRTRTRPCRTTTATSSTSSMSASGTAQAGASSSRTMNTVSTPSGRARSRRRRTSNCVRHGSTRRATDMNRFRRWLGARVRRGDAHGMVRATAGAVCQLPLAIGANTGNANVLLLLDNSGSMNEALVSSAYDPNTNYSGNFSRTSGHTTSRTSGTFSPRKFQQ